MILFIRFGCGALCYMSGSCHPSSSIRETISINQQQQTGTESQRKRKQQEQEEDEHFEIQYLNL